MKRTRAKKHVLSKWEKKSNQYNVVISEPYVSLNQTFEWIHILFYFILNMKMRILFRIFYEPYSFRSACCAALCFFLWINATFLRRCWSWSVDNIHKTAFCRSQSPVLPTAKSVFSDLKTGFCRSQNRFLPIPKPVFGDLKTTFWRSQNCFFGSQNRFLPTSKQFFFR